MARKRQKDKDESLLVDADALLSASEESTRAPHDPSRHVVVWIAPSGRRVKFTVHYGIDEPKEEHAFWRAHLDEAPFNVSSPAPYEPNTPVEALHALGEQIVLNAQPFFILTLDEIAETFGIDTWDTINERAIDNVSTNAWEYTKETYEDALEAGKTEEEADELRHEAMYKLEEEMTDEGYSKYRSALLTVADEALDEIDAELDGDYAEDWQFKVIPKTNWHKSAQALYAYTGGYNDSYKEWLAHVVGSSPKVAVKLNLDELRNSDMKRRFENLFNW